MDSLTEAARTGARSCANKRRSRRRRQAGAAKATAHSKDGRVTKISLASLMPVEEQCEPLAAVRKTKTETVAFTAAVLLRAGLFDHAASALRGNVWALASDRAGTRVVQRLLRAARPHDVVGILEEFDGRVLAACACPHANHALQCAIEMAPPARLSVVTASLLGCESAVACHCFGCRIFCRLLEHAAEEVGVQPLIDNLWQHVLTLSRHKFGRHVVQSLAEHGSATHRCVLACALGGDVVAHAQHMHSSYVIEAALVHCAPADKRSLCTALLDNESALARSPPGKFVLQAALRCSGTEHAGASAFA